jgi:dolichol kinase
MTEPRRGSLLRPTVHAATGLCALLLGVLPHPWELVAAGLGMLAGWVVLPLSPLERRLRRPGEGFLCGLRTYPLAVLGLVLLLPRTEAAAAWGVLAFGDGAAAAVGERVRSSPVFGHAKATWVGSSALVGVGAAAAFGLAHAVGALASATGLAGAGSVPVLPACVLAALAAAILDLVPLPPDDNLPAAAAAGGVLYGIRVWL